MGLDDAGAREVHMQRTREETQFELVAFDDVIKGDHVIIQDGSHGDEGTVVNVVKGQNPYFEIGHTSPLDDTKYTTRAYKGDVPVGVKPDSHIYANVIVKRLMMVLQL